MDPPAQSSPLGSIPQTFRVMLARANYLNDGVDDIKNILLLCHAYDEEVTVRKETSWTFFSTKSLTMLFSPSMARLRQHTQSRHHKEWGLSH